jgi:RNA polymerase sigma factor (sigma-70 family)
MASPARHDEFTAHLEAHKAILLKVANAYCRDRDDRLDLVQEMTAQLWRTFDRFDGRARFSTWMYRVALNVAISAQRRQRTQRQHVLPAAGDFVDVVDDRGSDAPDAALAQLRALIDGLGDFDKALMLLYLDGHEHATIAEILGISATNVGTKLGRLKAKLRDSFRLDGND